MLAVIRFISEDFKHTRASLGRVTSSSSADNIGRNSNASHGGREEVAGEAGVLATNVGLSVFGGAGALGALSNAVVGVICLVLAGARNLVAASDAATIIGTAWKS